MVFVVFWNHEQNSICCRFFIPHGDVEAALIRHCQPLHPWAVLASMSVSAEAFDGKEIWDENWNQTPRLHRPDRRTMITLTHFESAFYGPLACKISA